MLTSRFLFLAFLGSAFAVACGSSDKHRSTVLEDAGADGAVTADSGVGGEPNTTNDSGAETSTSHDAGKNESDSGKGPFDASADARTPSRDGGVEASVADGAAPLDAGFTLGEFCQFADPALEGDVRGALSGLNVDGGVPSGPIPVALAARVTSLDLFCDCSNTLDVAGIECLTGLASLSLSGAYANLDRLAYLPNLTQITFQYGDGTLPSELSLLKHLRTLDLQYDSMSDLTQLSDLTTLTDLELANNQVTDLTPLAGLVNLQTLNLDGNQISDLTPLAGLHALQNLAFRYNTVADLTPLAGLTSLTQLDAGQNSFTNLGPLSGLTNLQSLDINSSLSITDFSPLVANTGLGSGDQIYASPNVADCASFKADAQTLTSRGVTLNGFPTCP